MNTCETIQPDISRYVDGELPASEEAGIFAHAAACGTCREFLRDSLVLRSTLQFDPAPPVPARLDRRILALRPGGHRSTATETIRRWWTTRLPLPVPALAAAVVVLLAASLLLVRAITAPVSPPQTTRAEYILTLETVEVRGEPADSRSNGVRF